MRRTSHLLPDPTHSMSEESFREATGELPPLLSSVVDALLQVDGRARILSASHGIKRLLGYMPAELVKQPLSQLFPPDTLHDYDPQFERFLTTGYKTTSWTRVHLAGRHAEGSEAPLEVSIVENTNSPERTFAVLLRRNTLPMAALPIARELAPIARRLSAKTGDGYFRELVQHVAAILDADFVFVAEIRHGHRPTARTLALCVDKKLEDNIEYDLRGTPCADVLAAPGVCMWPQDVQRSFPKDDLLLEMGVHAYVGIPLPDSEGKAAGLFVALFRQSQGDLQRAASLLEIFALRTSAELERKTTAEQSLHREKLESIGRLAGGIAHDFNNLLTAVLGSIELAEEDLDDREALRSSLRDIRAASERAAGLTSQLLAFARRQMIRPVSLDPNERIKKIVGLLEPLLGERVTLQVVLSDNVGRILVDPGQFDQLLVNLTVNARDAMPSGGRLTIETDRIRIVEETRISRPEVVPGEYLQLVVSDTGVGMDQEVRERAFEPFFTTKRKGKGTGLGLASCHGIVRQNGGHIWLHSEPDHGTTFKLLFPLTTEPSREEAPRETSTPAVHGHETVLIVEDEECVLSICSLVLSRIGYHVLTAGSGTAALDVVRKHGGPIDLLMTDVILPDMRGDQVAAELGALVPGLRVLYTSGYTENVIVDQGVIREGMDFVPKPFSPSQVAVAVRKVLDRVR